MVRDLEKIAQEKGDTWPKILRNNYETYADKGIAMRTKRHGIWQRRTWKDYYMETKYLAMGMLSMGFEPGDKVAIIGDNSFQWYCAELAAQANHGIAVGMYSYLSSEEIKYILANSQSRYAIVEDQEQVDKLFEVMTALGRLKKIVCW